MTFSMALGRWIVKVWYYLRLMRLPTMMEPTFVREYLVDFDIAAAARRCGISKSPLAFGRAMMRRESVQRLEMDNALHRAVEQDQEVPIGIRLRITPGPGPVEENAYRWIEGLERLADTFLFGGHFSQFLR